MKKVLVTGSEGMLGQAIRLSLLRHRVIVEGADIRGRENTLDITNANDSLTLLDRIKPEFVIHTAAHTDVDACELAPDRAYLINGEGTKNIAQACRRFGIFLIYISTDFIFDGKKKTPYTEEDRPNPLNVYGESKLMGEEHIRGILKDYLIIRTCWLFGRGGRNFVDTIIDKAQAEGELSVVKDQVGSPTYATDLAEAIVFLYARLGSLTHRVLNITGSGSCSWHEFAGAILKGKGMKGVSLKPVTSSQIRRPAMRPAMSVLDNSKFIGLYRRPLPAWQDALKRYLSDS